MKHAWLAVVILIIAATVFYIGWWQPHEQATLLLPPSATAEGFIAIKIADGSAAREIAAQLEKQGAIKNAGAFLKLLRKHNWNAKLQPGLYRFETGKTAEEVARQIIDHQTWQIKVTLPEGLTLKQIAQRIEKAGASSTGQWSPRAAEIIKAATGQQAAEVLKFRVPAETAEGYLFPATYLFEGNATADDIVTRLLEEFYKRFAYKYRDDILRHKLSFQDIVTLASIVEREAARADERRIIAGVFVNRLNIGMKLESCATVQYALPQHKSRLMMADTRYPSPYNTYIHAGLPPGPICNPGLPSLLAALHPAKTDALYFVARGDGGHIFTHTFAEHEAAIQKIRGKH